VGPASGWGPAQTGGGDPGGPGSSSSAKGRVFRVVWLARLRDGIPLHMGLAQGCGLAQPKVRRAWQNGAVALQTYGAGIWQAGCSFIRLWCGEAFHNLSL
jgi:hypothetical protein